MTTTATPQGAEAQAAPDAIEGIIDGAETEAPKEAPQAEDGEPQAADSKPEEMFPKKAVNALSRRDKQIGKLRAEREALQAELAKYRQTTQQAPQNAGEPKEADFTNYHDYMRAVQKHDLQKELAERDTKTQETQRTQQDQAWTAQREQHVAATAQEFVKEAPDLPQLVQEYGELVDGWQTSHPHLTRLFLEADNAPLAFYNLAKEGKLEDLEDMSPAKAAMEIGRAQTQAIVKPKTKAPTPLPASRGSVPSGKSLDSMSGDELLKWVSS